MAHNHTRSKVRGLYRKLEAMQPWVTAMLRAHLWSIFMVSTLDDQVPDLPLPTHAKQCTHVTPTAFWLPKSQLWLFVILALTWSVDFAVDMGSNRKCPFIGCFVRLKNSRENGQKVPNNDLPDSR